MEPLDRICTIAPELDSAPPAEPLVARSRLRQGGAATIAIRYSTKAIDRARAVRVEAQEVRSLSVATRVRRFCRHHPTLAARMISGSSDADVALVASTIRGIFLCDSCIGRKTGIAQNDVTSMLAQIGKTVKITTELGYCEGCLRADLLSGLGIACD